jgi:hypothetical protein
MPAFIFEKISPPLHGTQNALTEKVQRRSVLVKILDRFGRSRRDPAAHEKTVSSEPKSE